MDGGDVIVRLAIMVVLATLAGAVAWWLQRRRPDPPSAPSYRAPSQIDRNDFTGPDRPILIVVFASTTCDSCPKVWEVVEPLGSGEIAVQRVDVQTGGDLHRRYKIDGVPTTLLVAGDGVVAQAYFGPLTSDELDPAIEVMKRALGSE